MEWNTQTFRRGQELFRIDVCSPLGVVVLRRRQRRCSELR
jgi:hypothetical protein